MEPARGFAALIRYSSTSWAIQQRRPKGLRRSGQRFSAASSLAWTSPPCQAAGSVNRSADAGMPGASLNCSAARRISGSHSAGDANRSTPASVFSRAAWMKLFRVCDNATGIRAFENPARSSGRSCSPPGPGGMGRPSAKGNGSRKPSTMTIGGPSPRSRRRKTQVPACTTGSLDRLTRCMRPDFSRRGTMTGLAYASWRQSHRIQNSLSRTSSVTRR